MHAVWSPEQSACASVWRHSSEGKNSVLTWTLVMRAQAPKPVPSVAMSMSAGMPASRSCTHGAGENGGGEGGGGAGGATRHRHRVRMLKTSSHPWKSWLCEIVPTGGDPGVTEGPTMRMHAPVVGSDVGEWSPIHSSWCAVLGL